MAKHTDFQLLYPPIIEFGVRCRKKLPEVLATVCPGKRSPRILLVTIKTLVRNGKIDEFVEFCGGAEAGVFSKVEHDPSLETVNKLIAVAREGQADAIVAVGGGSVIDAAKAAAIVAPTGATVTPYHRGKRPIEGPGLPLIALPTTAGTGAEVTKNAVLTDRERGIKQSLRSPYMVPRAALVDPELTLALPADLTAQSGLDALTQAIESFVSLRANIVSRALAAKAVQRLMMYLPRAYTNNNNVRARQGVAEGSLLSGMAFSQSGLGAVHGLAHPIGHALSMPHGYACAVMLPHIMRWNAPVCEGDFQQLAGIAACSSVDEFIDRVEALCRELDIPENFADYAVGSDHIDIIIRGCRSGSMKANPREMTDDDLEDLLEKLI